MFDTSWTELSPVVPLQRKLLQCQPEPGKAGWQWEPELPIHTPQRSQYHLHRGPVFLRPGPLDVTGPGRTLPLQSPADQDDRDHVVTCKVQLRLSAGEAAKGTRGNLGSGCHDCHHKPQGQPRL